MHVTLSQPAPVTQSRRRCRCGNGTNGTTCHDCLVGQAEFELSKLHDELRNLVNGRGVFWALTVQERADMLARLNFVPAQVATLMDDTALIAVIADERSSDAAIASATEELASRFDRLGADWGRAFRTIAQPQAVSTGEPSAEERQRIEDEDEQYHRELTLQREAQAEAEDPERFDGLS